MVQEQLCALSQSLHLFSLLSLHVRKSYPYIEEGLGGSCFAQHPRGHLGLMLMLGQDHQGEKKSSPSPPGSRQLPRALSFSWRHYYPSPSLKSLYEPPRGHFSPFLSFQTHLEDPIYTQHARKGHLQADTARFRVWRVNCSSDSRKRLYRPKKGLLAGLGRYRDLQKDAKRPKRGYRIGAEQKNTLPQ